MKLIKVPIFVFGLLLSSGMVLSCRKESLPDGPEDDKGDGLVFRVESEGYEIPLRKDATAGVFVLDSESYGSVRSNAFVLVGDNGEAVQEEDTLLGPDPAMIYAYSPYSSAWDDALDSVMEFSVEEDQSAELSYVESDLMWSAGVAVQHPLTQVVLSHAMARIMIHMTSHDSEKDMRDVQIMLGGMKTGGYVYLREQVVQTDTSSVSDIICHVMESVDRRTSMAAVVPPQKTASDSLVLKIRIGDSVYDYEVPAAEGFAGGRQYVYAVHMADEDLLFDGCTVSDWTDDGNFVIDMDPSLFR